MWTVYRTSRGSRKRELRRRSFPGAKERVSWRGEARRRSSVGDVRVESLQEQNKEGVREVRRFEEKRIEVRRGVQAHCRCRFRVETPADASDSDEEFRRPGGVSCRRTKGIRRRGVRAFYSRGLMANYSRENERGHYSGEAPLPVRGNGWRRWC
jgi:hypothetical protein